MTKETTVRSVGEESRTRLITDLASSIFIGEYGYWRLTFKVRAAIWPGGFNRGLGVRILGDWPKVTGETGLLGSSFFLEERTLGLVGRQRSFS